MKRFSVIAAITFPLCFPQMILSAQQKWDAIWLFGYEIPSGDSLLYHTKFDFHYDPVKITATVVGFVNFDGANAGICNEDGELQFVTDKCDVSNWNGWPPMQGGENMSNDKYDSLYCSTGGGIGQQSILALPWPDSADQYILFYYGFGSVPIANDLKPLKLYWARIDMRLNNGQGAVVEKHNIIVQDTLASGYLQAVRHANGRDWWVLTPEAGSNCYYTIKLNPTGPHMMFKQCAGQPWLMNKDWIGQAVFSPDGATYARMNWHYDLHVFDFDRCSGLLSNERTADFPNDIPYNTGGVAISANSRYVYATTTTRLWHLDLKSPDLDASKILIDTYDGQPFPDYGVFYLSYLAPDNKIYIAGTSSHRHLHVINAPDSAGLACDFAQHGVPIPTFNYTSLPNYPFFRLGAAGVPCDSISGVGVVLQGGRANEVKIFPNPAADQLHVIGLEGYGVITIADVSGKMVFLQKGAWLSNTQETIDISSLAPGFYFVSVQQNESVQQLKIVKQ